MARSGCHIFMYVTRVTVIAWGYTENRINEGRGMGIKLIYTLFEGNILGLTAHLKHLMFDSVK